MSIDKMDSSLLRKKISESVQLKNWIGKLDFITDLEVKEALEQRVQDKQNFLGEGGAGIVFRIDNKCIKLMRNRHNNQDAHLYNLGNHPKVEAEIQHKLKDFEVRSVSVPKIYNQYHDDYGAAIVMEELDAVNLQLVLNNQEQLPDNFDLKEAFDELDEFIYIMNTQEGVAHNDLAPRNLMIDKKTGKFKVIDFGRSIVKSDNNSKTFQKAIDDDAEKVEEAQSKLEAYLAKN
jgi:serine/threonine protein kinase